MKAWWWETQPDHVGFCRVITEILELAAIQYQRLTMGLIAMIATTTVK